jgi:hypothetical protein
MFAERGVFPSRQSGRIRFHDRLLPQALPFNEPPPSESPGQDLYWIEAGDQDRRDGPSRNGRLGEQTWRAIASGQGPELGRWLDFHWLILETSRFPIRQERGLSMDPALLNLWKTAMSMVIAASTIEPTPSN